MKIPNDNNDLAVFLSLFNEEYSQSDPLSYLVDLWRQDRQRCCELIRSTPRFWGSYRGMNDCIVSACLQIGNEARDVVEEMALGRAGSSKQGSGILWAAILLGSTKAVEKFRKRFEKSFSCDISEWERIEVLEYVKAIAFLRMTGLHDLILKLVSLKDAQYHRIQNPLFWGIPAKLFPEGRQKRLNYVDYRTIKLAEAVHVYFTKGSCGLKEYLKTKGDSEYRAWEYLFCIACDRNPNDFDYFRQQYGLYKDPLIKNLCIEAIVYTGDQNKAAEFIDEELGRFNLDRLVNKKGYDFKILAIKAHDSLFYSLLEACYYLKTLNEGLVHKLKVLAKAKDWDTLRSAMLILDKNKIMSIDKKIINIEQKLFWEALLLSSPLLGMAKLSGRL